MERNNLLYVPFRPMDTVICTRHYEKERIYKVKDTIVPNFSCPHFGKPYIVSEVGIDKNGEVWIGLYRVAGERVGWRSGNFKLSTKGKKTKGEKNSLRMIRI